MPRRYDSLMDAIKAGEITLSQALFILNEIAFDPVDPGDMDKVLDGQVCEVTFFEDCMTAFWDSGPGHCIPIGVKEFDTDEPRIWQEG